ncbi:MAG: DUF2325 domain-containing protein [Candidatus Riflebacteria bacterium]|nr:DUF2325 domain-containing protein [Candidatus Riflebacteria bacterium]
MIDEYWVAVYERLQNDYDFLKLLCNDTSNAELLKWIMPNKLLQMKCARFIKKGKIVNKSGIVDELVKHSANEAALRKIILFNWIENNHLTMKFLDLNVDENVANDLNNGKFGDVQKVEILSKIDPRDGADRIYGKYFELHEKQIVDVAAPDESDAKADEDLKNEKEFLESRVQQLESALNKVKKDNKELKENLEIRVKEVTKLSVKLAEQTQYLNEWQQKSEQLRAKLGELNAKLEFETKAASESTELFDKEQLSVLNDLRAYSDKLKAEVTNLKQALANRDASVARLEKENEELKNSVKTENGYNSTIANLQAKLEEFEKKDSLDMVVGQLVSRQLFVSVYKEPVILPEGFTQRTGLVFDEFALLSLDESGVPLRIESLERNIKKEIIGIIKSEQGTFFLETEDEKFHVMIPISAKFIGRPVRGVLLPEAENRDEGIYRVDSLESEMQKTAPAAKRAKSSKTALHKEKDLIFNGEKVLIIGGDRVGHEYEQALASHGLEVTWRSGFESIKDLRSGFSPYRAVAIIVKQLSHTLLREIILAAEKSGVQVIFCAKRGISGVLDCLKDSLLPCK